MLTVFSTPKPFKGHIGVIQRNAIQSWIVLHPDCEVIVLGNEEGTAEIASELGIRHVPDVECNEYGTPLVSSLFDIAQDIASNDILCYVNADVILTNTLINAIHRIDIAPFLLVGQRWDLDLNAPISFSNTGWETNLMQSVRDKGILHGPSGLDYFVFTRGLYHDIPSFAIGRPAWDGWIVHQARVLGAAVIDATDAVTVIHQNHDYSHHPGGKTGIWEGMEATHNRGLAKQRHFVIGLHNANLVLTPDGLKPAITKKHLLLRLRVMRYSIPGLSSLETLVISLMRSIKKSSSKIESK